MTDIRRLAGPLHRNRWKTKRKLKFHHLAKDLGLKITRDDRVDTRWEMEYPNRKQLKFAATHAFISFEKGRLEFAEGDAYEENDYISGSCSSSSPDST